MFVFDHCNTIQCATTIYDLAQPVTTNGGLITPKNYFSNWCFWMFYTWYLMMLISNGTCADTERNHVDHLLKDIMWWACKLYCAIIIVNRKTDFVKNCVLVKIVNGSLNVNKIKTWTKQNDKRVTLYYSFGRVSRTPSRGTIEGCG